MLISIIIILCAFTWLIIESDFLRVRLLVGVAEIKQEPILLLKAPSPETIFECSPDVIQFSQHIDAREFYRKLNNLSKQEITITQDNCIAKTKVKTVRIGHGVYNLALLKQLFNNFPDNTTVGLQSIKAFEYDNGTIPALKCTWQNHVARGNWTLKSGYEVSSYRIDGDYDCNNNCYVNTKVKAQRMNMGRNIVHLLPNNWMAAIDYMAVNYR
jgi:hypothetical protein